MKRLLLLIAILLVATVAFAQAPPQHYRPDTAYVLVVGPWQPQVPDNPKFPSHESEFNDGRGGYYALYRITDAVPFEDKFNIDAWEVAIPPTRIVPINPSTPALTYMKANRVYVFQVSWYKERLSIRYQLRWAPTLGVAPVYYGCATDLAPTGICSEASMDACWCDVAYDEAEVDDGCAAPGASGLFLSGAPGSSAEPETNPQLFQSFDNVKVYAFRPPPGDGAPCGGTGSNPTPVPTLTPTPWVQPTPPQ